MYKQVKKKKTEASWNFRVRMRRLSPAGSREESAETEKILQEMPMRSLSVKPVMTWKISTKSWKNSSATHWKKDYIDISDVEAITTEQTENKIFDMIDAVALHQQKKALDLYYDLLALKEAPMRILFLLSSQFQRLMIVKSMTNQGFGNKEIAF